VSEFGGKGVLEDDGKGKPKFWLWLLVPKMLVDWVLSEEAEVDEQFVMTDQLQNGRLTEAEPIYDGRPDA